MKALFLFITSLLASTICNCQVNISKKRTDTLLKILEKQKAQIDQYEFKHREEITTLVQLSGRKALVKVKNDSYPDNTEYIYNVVKDSTGKVIAIEQIPYSESGDWYEEFKHYFDANGKTLAFSKRETVFDDGVKTGVAVEDSFDYYDSSFSLLLHTTRLTDSNSKLLKGRKASEFDFRSDPYHEYKDSKSCIIAYKIKL